MRPNQQIFLLACFLALASRAPAQRYQSRIYTEDEGLPNSLVYDVAQDASGRLWFATRSGIVVYDGLTWETENEGLAVLAYHAIEVAGDGRVYAASRSHDPPVVYFDGETWVPLGHIRAGPFKTITFSALATTLIEGEVTVALGTEQDGLFLWQGSAWQQLALADSIKGIAAHDGVFYVATGQGLKVIAGNQVEKHFDQLLNLPPGPILGIAIEPKPGASSLLAQNATIWLQGRNWVGVLQGHRFVPVIAALNMPFLKHAQQLVLQPDGTGGLFFGENGGLIHYNADRASFTQLDSLNGLSAAGITSAFMDREKNFWFTTYRGVTKIPGLRFANFDQSQGLLEDEVTAVIEVEPDVFLFGHNTGFTWYDGTGFEPWPLSDRSNPLTRVLDLHKDVNGVIWAAVARKGLARIENRQKPTWFGAEDGLPGDPFSVLTDQSGTLWVGGTHGLFKYEDGRFTSVDTGLERGGVIRRLFLGPDDSLQMATSSQGMLVKRDNRISHYQVPDNQLGNRVYAIFTDSRNRTWVGTMAGIYTLQQESLLPARFGGQELNRPVYFICEDRGGRLWFGTDNGVMRWDGEQMRRFTLAEGLAGRETNRAAGYVDRRGRIWIGTDRGVSRYQETYDSQDLAPPLVSLVALEAGGQPHPPDQHLSLPFDRNDLVFHFRSLSFINEEAPRYEIKLEGYDRDWLSGSQVERGQIRYTNLPPGKYRFFVRAANPHGTWSQPTSSAEILIQKPFWKSGWFIGLLCLLSGALVYSVQRYFSQMGLASVLKTEVAERTRELNQTNKLLRQGLRDREEAEQALQRELKERERIEETLQKELREREIIKEALQVAKEGAEAGSRSKSEFLATMSHEIRTPLNGIIGMTSLLQETQPTLEQQEYIETVRISGQCLLALINDILDFSKLEAGKIILDCHAFAPRTCIEDTFDILATQAATKQIELLFKIDPRVPSSVMGDHSRLRQVLVNLVGNAVKFTESGEVMVTLDTEPVPSAGRGDQLFLRFSVADTGIGIPTQQQGALFQPFFQGKAGSDPKYEGTGLGLVISHRLVTEMGGRITVESEPGKGSTFTFTTLTRPAPTNLETTPDLTPVAGRYALIATGNPKLLRILEDHCRSWQIKTEVARPETASSRLRQNNYDFAILDQSVFNSLERQWEDDDTTAPVSLPPIVLLQMGARHQTRLPVAAWIHKPLKPPILLQALLNQVTRSEQAHRHTTPAPKIDATLATRMPLRILIAEDNSINQKIALRILAKMGYAADLAGNGLEVLQALEHKHYDVIFMDIQMPEMDGLQAARVINRTLASMQKPRIIALTANVLEENRERCREAGIDDFLCKPIVLKDMQQALERCFIVDHAISDVLSEIGVGQK